MTEKVPVIRASIPLSKMTGESRLIRWEMKQILMDEEGNEEPTLPGVDTEIPLEFVER